MITLHSKSGSILTPTLSALLALLLLVSGCSNQSLLIAQDYRTSQNDFLRGDSEKALQHFPNRAEHGTFITTMEKTYLALIQGKPDIKALQQQEELLEKRVRYHVSREARNFFYVQTPEDYFASEHEVIWMHFLLSWGYSMQEKYGDACVEARIAGSLLSLSWSPEGHFDDPAMRLFLAGLWTMCGEWREAQVDLRAAWYMDNSLTWAKDLAELSRPPEHLFLVLGGPGPEPLWSPELTANPLRSERQINFRLRGVRSTLSIRDHDGNPIKTYLSPDAGNWYARHLARESELHELILDSTYGGKAAFHSTVAGSKIAAATGMGMVIGLSGTALGAAIIYYGTGDAILYGLTIAAASIDKGIEISRREYRESTSQLKQELDPSLTYRFVRYLPEYLWMGWSDSTISYPVELRTPSAKISITQPEVNNRTAVSINYLPDNRSSCGNRAYGGITYVPLPNSAGDCASSAIW